MTVRTGSIQGVLHMRASKFVIGLVSAIFVASSFAPDADGRRRKRRPRALVFAPVDVGKSKPASKTMNHPVCTVYMQVVMILTLKLLLHVKLI